MVNFLLGFTANALGYMISSIFNKPETAVALAPLITLPMSLFGGYISNTSTIPSWINWFQYISPIRYAFECMVHNEFDNRTDLIVNPLDLLGFTFTKSFCLWILFILSISFRVLPLIFLKVFITKF